MRTSIKNCVLAVLGAMILPIVAMADYTCTTNGYTFYYTINGGMATIENHDPKVFPGTEFVVPNSLGGMPVRVIGSNSFNMMTNTFYASKRGKAFVENGPTEIAHGAFYTDGPGWECVCVPPSVVNFTGAWCFRKIGKLYWTISSSDLVIDRFAFSIPPDKIKIIATCDVPNTLHDSCDLWDSFDTYYSHDHHGGGKVRYKCRREYFASWTNRGDVVNFIGFVGDGYDYGKPAIVHFNVNGGSAIPDGSYRQGSPYETLPTPVRSGYTFVGWYTEPYPEADYPDGIKVDVDDVVASPAETLYAHWKANPPVASAQAYSGVYDGFGHKISVSVSSPLSGATIAYSLSSAGPFSS